MDAIVVFELRGPMAHYRRPDTLGTHASYPFIPRTALRGLAAAILGREDLPPESRCGLRLLGPVKMSTQQLSMHGKKWIGGGRDFHRPTTIELVVKPHYRVFYAGPLADDLAGRLERKLSHYHTYLGSAYCLTFPEWIGRRSSEPLPADAKKIVCESVVPSAAIGELLFQNGEQYARVGGMLRDHVGARRFRGTVSVIYEATGQPLTFNPACPSDDVFWEFHQVSDEGTICLW